jgi:hypothetical protein
MLYAVLCYHSEEVVFSWTKEEDAAVMEKLAVVTNRLTAEGRFRGALRLLPTTAATSVRDGDGPIILDGPFVETKEQLLGFYVIDFDDLEHALSVVKELSAANPGAGYEVRPVGYVAPGSAIS